MPNLLARTTLYAFRQRVYDALTSPQLSYVVEGATIVLPTANVIPKLLWEIGSNPPTPLVAYSIADRGDASIAVGRYLSYRKLGLKFWCLSGNSMDEVTGIYEAVRALFNYADQDATNGTVDLSRAGTGATNQGVVVALCRETEALDPRYETETKRWYLSASYDVVAL